LRNDIPKWHAKVRDFLNNGKGTAAYNCAKEAIGLDEAATKFRDQYNTHKAKMMNEGKCALAKLLAKEAAVLCIGAVAYGIGADPENIIDAADDIMHLDYSGVLENLGDIAVDVLSFQTGVQAKEFTELGHEIWEGHGWGALNEFGDIVLAAGAYQAGVKPDDIRNALLLSKTATRSECFKRSKRWALTFFNVKARLMRSFNRILGQTVLDQIIDYSKTANGGTIKKYFDAKVRQVLGKKILDTEGTCGGLRKQAKDITGLNCLSWGKNAVGSFFDAAADKVAKLSCMPWVLS